MSEPAADHIDLDASFEQVDGGGVPEGVRADLSAGAGVVEAGCVPADDLVDAVAGEGLPVGSEHRRAGRGRRLGGAVQGGQQLCSLLPERAGAPFAAFAVHVYRKIHLFDVDLPGRVTVRESDAKLAGAEVVTGATPLGAIGFSICYDLRFPELYRRLTFAGAQIIAIPSAFTFPTGEAHWEPLLRARAIENQAYVIAPAQFGPNIYGYSDYGNSMIVDPWGRVIARAADQEGVVVAPIDLEYQERVRRELPALKHARLQSPRR